MLYFNRIPFKEFESEEEFRISKNKWHDIVVSHQIHKKTGLEFKDIRLYSNTYQAFMRRGVRIPPKNYLDLIDYLSQLDKELDECISDEEFERLRSLTLFEEDESELIVKPFIRYSNSYYGKNYRGFSIGWYDIDGDPSWPNVIWIPAAKIGEFVEKSKKIPKRDYKEKKINFDEFFSLVKKTEEDLREFIRNKLEEEYGIEWWNIGGPEGVQEYAKEKYEKNLQPWKNKTSSDYQELYYVNIPHLKEIIINRKNWKLFKEFFGDKKEVEVQFNNFSRFRNAIVHSHPPDEYIYAAGIAGLIFIKKCIEDI